LYTQALGPGGKVIGELAEQVPYQEWLHSSYKDTQSCQDCHMPPVPGAVPITAVLGQPREGVRRHEFLGGNFFMPRLLNRFREEMGVNALPQELDKSSMKTVEHLQSEAAKLSFAGVELRAGVLEAEVVLRNLAGHKLPTAYPSRRAWLRFTVRDAGGAVVFESGGLNQDGSIRGNDNDADGGRFEPHYTVITEAGQVQIYEDIMADSAGALTTGLLKGVRYLKDNRVPPKGFDKRGASGDVAVIGGAFDDPDFSGGEDRIRYSVPLAGARGPFEVEAELWYQPIGFRWAMNLRQFDAPEPRRFIRFWETMAPGSALRLARVSASR
jgi:hypothetical protein